MLPSYRNINIAANYQTIEIVYSDISILAANIQIFKIDRLLRCNVLKYAYHPHRILRQTNDKLRLSPVKIRNIIIFQSTNSTVNRKKGVVSTFVRTKKHQLLFGQQRYSPSEIWLCSVFHPNEDEICP